MSAPSTSTSAPTTTTTDAHLYGDASAAAAATTAAVPAVVTASRGKLTHELSTYSLPFDIAVARRQEAGEEDCTRLRAVWQHNKAVNEYMRSQEAVVVENRRLHEADSLMMKLKTMWADLTHPVKEADLQTQQMGSKKSVVFDDVKTLEVVSSVDDTGAVSQQNSQ